MKEEISEGEIIVVLAVALICAHIQIGIVLLYVIILDWFSFCREKQRDDDKEHSKLVCFIDTIQGIIGLCIGVSISGTVIALLTLAYALVWVIPITNPFFSVWYLKQRREDDDDDDD